jgi:hypothetical protein
MQRLREGTMRRPNDLSWTMRSFILKERVNRIERRTTCSHQQHTNNNDKKTHKICERRMIPETDRSLTLECDSNSKWKRIVE